MKPEDKATPRPWKYSPYHKSIQGTEVSQDGCVIKIADLDLSNFGVNEGNANLIVQAVNEYDDLKRQNEALVEACKKARQTSDDHETVEIINNALAQAEGKGE